MVGLTAILLPIALQPFIEDLRIRYRSSRRGRRSRSRETTIRRAATAGAARIRLTNAIR